MVAGRSEMTFITKIFLGKVDEPTHRQFTRFSRGVFENRAIMRIKKTKENIKVRFSADLVADMTRLAVQHIKEAEVSGRVMKGKKKTNIQKKTSQAELQQLLSEYDAVLLDIEAPNVTLKCKKSMPKPGKMMDDRFGSATLPLDVAKELVFETSSFSEASIRHTFDIKDVSIPDEYKNDLALARFHGKRVGIITRYAIIDGKESQEQKEFAV